MKLVYISLAFVLGVYSGSCFHIPPGYGLLLIAALPLIAVAMQITKRVFHMRRLGMFAVLVTCIISFIFGAVRFAAAPASDGLLMYAGQENVSVTGVIVEEPEATNTSIKLIVSVREIDGEEASGILLVRTARYPTLEYGDLLSITGDIELPEEDLEGFNYCAYLNRQDIYTTMFYPEVELRAKEQGPQPWQALYSFRHRLGETLSQSLPEPEGSMARAVILGLRHDIPPSIYEDFQRSGTAHLLAISGLHMSIIAGIVLSLCVRLFGRHRPTYFIATLGVLWLYSILAGMSPSVLRAAIMISLYLLGAHLGRQRSGLTAVTFAAAMMVAFDPDILWQVSFQLSFGAVLGLILIAPPLQDLLSRTRGPRLLVDSFAYSLGAIAATLPLTAYYFGYVSLWSLLATFLATLALPAIIVVTALTAFAGLIWLPAARVIGWADWLLLKYTVAVVQGFAAIPHAAVELSQIKVWMIWAYYGFTAAVMWLGARVKRRFNIQPSQSDLVIIDLSIPTPAKWCIGTLSIIAILTWAAVFTAPDSGKMQVTFIDVGQGDSILIKSPSNRYVLVDGGAIPEKLCVALGEALPFWDHSIDIMVMTHPHDDHANGLIEVVKRYDVDRALLPFDTIQEYKSGDYLPGSQELVEALESRGIECIRATAGQTIDIGGGATIEVLNPQATPYEGTDSDVDNNGVVLRVSMSDISFLLAADLYRDGELRMVCSRATLDSTVLKVCHHGSKSSSRPYWLEAVSPQAAVVSVGADNRYGHPNASVIEHISKATGEELVFLTSEHGTVTFTTDGERLWVETER